MTIELLRDGNMIGALIGPDLQAGISGWGETVADALRDLADAIEREEWKFPKVEPPSSGLIRVK